MDANNAPEKCRPEVSNIVADQGSLVREVQAEDRLIDTQQMIAQESISDSPHHLYSWRGATGHRFLMARTFPNHESLATRFLRGLNYRGVAEVIYFKAAFH